MNPNVSPALVLVNVDPTPEQLAEVMDASDWQHALVARKDADGESFGTWVSINALQAATGWRSTAASARSHVRQNAKRYGVGFESSMAHEAADVFMSRRDAARFFVVDSSLGFITRARIRHFPRSRGFDLTPTAEVDRTRDAGPVFGALLEAANRDNVALTEEVASLRKRLDNALRDLGAENARAKSAEREVERLKAILRNVPLLAQTSARGVEDATTVALSYLQDGDASEVVALASAIVDQAASDDFIRTRRDLRAECSAHAEVLAGLSSRIHEAVAELAPTHPIDESTIDDMSAGDEKVLEFAQDDCLYYVHFRVTGVESDRYDQPHASPARGGIPGLVVEFSKAKVTRKGDDKVIAHVQLCDGIERQLEQWLDENMFDELAGTVR